MSIKKYTIKFFKYFFISSISIIISTLIIISITLFTHTGGQLLIKVITHFESRLSIELVDGGILKNSQFKNISWLAEGTSIAISTIDYQFDWSCLVKRLCLTSLNIDDINVKVAPSNATEPELPPSTLAFIDIPIEIIINEINLTNIHITKGELTIDVHEISLQGHAFAHDVTLSSQINGVLINLPVAKTNTPTSKPSVATTPKKQKMLAMQSLPALLTHEMLASIALPVNLHIQAFQLNKLNIKQNQQTLFTLNGLISALNFKETQLSITQFTLDLPETSLTLRGGINFIDDYPLDIQIDGQLKKIKQLQPTSLLKDLRYQLKINGRLSDLTTQLTLSNKINLQLRTHVDLLADNLPHNIALNWQKLQWPLSGKVQYSAQQGSFTSKGSLLDNQINMHSDYAIAGVPSGNISLKTTANLQHLQVESLKIDTLSGIAEFSGLLNWQDKIDWLGQLKITDIDLAPLKTQYNGHFSGLIKQHITVALYEDDAPDWQFDFPELNITGELLSRPLSLTGHVSGDNKQGIILNALSLKNGNNNIIIDGRLAQENALTIAVNIPDISSTVLGGEGEITGSINIDGPIDALQVNSQLTGKTLAYQSYKIKKIDVNSQLTLTPKPQLTLQLNAQNILVEQQLINDITLNINNDSTREHRVDLVVNSESASADMMLFVMQTENELLAQVKRANVFIDNQTLSLISDFTIIAQQQQVKITPHCWKMHTATLTEPGKFCIKKLSVGESGDVSAFIDNYSLTVLNLFLPKALKLAGTLSANASVKWLKDSQPTFNINVFSENMLLKIKNNINSTGFIDYPMKTFNINLQGYQQQLDIEANIFAEELVDIQLKGQVKPYDSSPTVNVNIISTLPDFSLFLPLMPLLENLQGQLNSQLTVTGRLQKPAINGTINIQNGAMSSTSLPLKISHLGAIVEVKNNTASLQGSFDSSHKNTIMEKTVDIPLITKTFSLLDKSIKKISNKIINKKQKKSNVKKKKYQQPGMATIKGNVDWSNGLKGDVHFYAHKLVIYDYGKIDLLITPEIHMLFDKHVKINGQLLINSGKIVAEELPKGAILQSDDIIVIDIEKKNVTQDLPIEMNLSVDSGNDFQIIALGLDTFIQGKLLIKKPLKKDLTINGVLELSDGSYRSMGQELVLQDSRILFQGSPEAPYLQIEAIRDTSKVEDDVIAGIRVTGTPDELELVIFSEPAMAQQEALSYLTRGRALNSTSDDNASMANMLIDIAAGQSGNVMSSIGEEIGIKDLSLSTTGSGDEQSVGVSGEIAPGVELSYGIGVFDDFSIISLRYELFERFYIEASSGIYQAVDAYYQWDWD